MMESTEHEVDHLLVQLTLLEELQAPVKKVTRLKYNCVSVSNKLVAVGSNTGGIYLFSRNDCRLLQVAFADKETGSVSLVQISPNEKFVAFASLGAVHVLDIKLESRSKPETLRSISDLSGAMATVLLWDQTSTKLFIGDDLGKVSMIHVHSSKAKNLFSAPHEVIMKLDSVVVQMDKAEDKILVSTLSRCYLCDTVKQQFSQIGKKLRDGQFGACFLTQGASAPMIYCARPGSRIWEVDFEGSVLNTHQFKQLLAVPPVTVLRPDGHFEPPDGNHKYLGQAVTFPKLKVLSNNFLLSWTSTSVYVLDPINVKVILWSNNYSGILDVCCLKNELFIFHQTMQLQCFSIMPVTGVIPLCEAAKNSVMTANLCIYYENMFHSQNARKVFDTTDWSRIHDHLIDDKHVDLAEKLESVIKNIENKMAAESETDSTDDSSRSRSSSSVSVLSTSDGMTNGGTITNETQDGHTKTEDSITKRTMASELKLEHVEMGTLQTDKKNLEDEKFNSKTSQSDKKGEDEHSLLHTTGELKDGEDEEQNVLLNEVATGDANLGEVKLTVTDTTDGPIVETSNDSIAIVKEVNLESKKLHSNIEEPGVEKVIDFKDMGKSDVLPEDDIDGALVQSDVKPDNLNINNIEVDEKGASSQINPITLVQVVEIETEGVHNDLLIAQNDSLNGNASEKTKKLSDNGETAIVNQDEKTLTGAIPENTSADQIENCDAMNSASKISKTKTDEIFISEEEQLNPTDNLSMSCTPRENVDINGAPADAETFTSLRVKPQINESLSPILSCITMETQDDQQDAGVDDEDFEFHQSKSGNTRRSSLNSLTSLSSAEVFIDQNHSNVSVPSQKSDQIAIAVKRKSSRKKKRKVSLEDSGNSKKEGRLRRSHSLGAVPIYTSKKDAFVSPQGSIHNTIEEDCVSVSPYSSQSADNKTGMQSYMEDYQITEEKNGDTVSADSPLSYSGEYGGSGEFGGSGQLSRSGNFSPSESPLGRSLEKTKEGKTSSVPKTAFLQLRDKMQNKVSAKTKNLIRNIKEKNLLTRAKVFAENLSQGTENMLPTGEVFYMDPPEIVMDPDVTEYMENEAITKHDQQLDELDGITKSIVDIKELQEITVQTQDLLQDVDTLMNPEAVYKILSDWVTVLNQTFQQLHIRKFTHSEDHEEREASKNTDFDRNKTGLEDLSSSALHESGTKMQNGDINLDENRENDEIKDKLRENDDENSITFKTTADEQIVCSQHKNNCGTDILQDRDFCHVTDPLNLPRNIFKDVSELAQACFDLGCHGNILKYSQLETCIVSDCTNKEPDKSGGHTSDFQTDQGESNNVKEEKDDNPRDCDIVDKGELSNVKEEKDDNSRICDIFDKGCEKEPDCDNSQLHSSGSITSDTLDMEGVGALNVDEFKPDHERNGNKLDQTLKNASSCTKTIIEEAVPNKSESILGCQGHAVNTDQAMSFFVRCYFPYLSSGRIRVQILNVSCDDQYQTWCALVSCLEANAMHAGERYGIEDGSIINHILDSQSSLDGGERLLGHISKLFRSSNPDLISVCVKCHPYIQPLDVMYMCGLHQVAMDTVFKHYMVKMCELSPTTHRVDITDALYRRLDVSALWLQLLLADGSDTDAVFDKDGHPRVMSHKHGWSNEAMIEEIFSKSHDLAGMETTLEVCKQFGYWPGVLRILKQTKNDRDHIDIILWLRDLELLNDHHKLGYQPCSVRKWEELLSSFSLLTQTSGYQSSQLEVSDWSSTITWNNLAISLVKHVGPDSALSLLEKHEIPDGVLSPEFFQTCVLSGMVQKHQRSILHSMLEKIDTYLWSQRPQTLTPQLHYLVLDEKRLIQGETTSSQQDRIQSLTNQLKDNQTASLYIEDPECHWGVETKFNVLCHCCNIAIAEPVSHDEPGVLLFRCGHGFHKLCLPDRECILCEVSTEGVGSYTL